MRYSVPINAANEAGPLAAAGAAELYCGYLDDWWAARYGDHDSASRRQGSANLRTPNDLQATVVAAREQGLSIHLALNARYTEPQLDYLVGLCHRFENWGGAGIIISDLGLLWRLHQEMLAGASKLTLTLSLLAVAQNAPTLQAYEALGISRMVLPRFVRPAEAGALLAQVPGVEASVMAFFDKCPLVDGYCRHRHGVTYRERVTGDGEEDEPARSLHTFDTTYRTHACLGTSCDYLEPYPCAACHLQEFQMAGVGIAKIGGRGRPLEERLRALRFLRAAELLAHEKERRMFYEETFGRPCACYYGVNTQARTAIERIDEPSAGQVRTYMGSQTNTGVFWKAVHDLCEQGPSLRAQKLTLLVPPLSDAEMRDFARVLPALEQNVPGGTHVAANDLGTLGLVAGSSLTPTLGTLFARLDNPREVEHFLSPEQNPPRSVWDAQGRPRTLVYVPPPDALVRHWASPSACEPSAQQALAYLYGHGLIAYEFDGCVP